MSNKKISTSALAKEYNLSPKELFKILEKKGYITYENKITKLTDLGKKSGGEMKKGNKFSEFKDYIVWPKDFFIQEKLDKETTQIQENTTKKHTPKELFKILEKKGYITYENKITKLTDLGKKSGGEMKKGNKFSEFKDYIVWPKDFFIQEKLDKETTQTQENTTKKHPQNDNFRSKFKAEHRTNDGHFVRSKAETLICNWLFQNEIAHAYERRLPIEENLYSDFYLPKGKVYIEYWGYENSEKYLQRKKQKLELYSKYGFNLIELNETDVQNLDDVLPKKIIEV